MMWNVNLEPTIGKKMVGSSRGSLSNVSTSGATLTLAITKLAEIQQLSIIHFNVGQFNVDIYADSIFSQQILSLQSDATLNRVDLTKMGLYFENMDTPKTNSVYVKITPLSGSGHLFSVSLFYDKF